MKIAIPLFLALILTYMNVHGARNYSIDLNVFPRPIESGHLDLGGTRPDGGRYEVNSFYIVRDGVPFIPIVGEFHYSRFPAAGWEESLRKMKAGGINTVATYVFWNLHERQEGTFDFSGNLDLRAFLETVKQVGLSAIVRIGPFCHGEIRNGGLPDWLYGREFEVRSNDSGYMEYVDRLYREIGARMTGLYFKDGGPVIGIQLENEYQHSAAPWELSYPGATRAWTVADLNRSVTYSQISETTGENPHAEYGREHMRQLKAIAQKYGMITPLYTATGWGNAAIVPQGSLPVSAGYAYPFWSAAKPSPFFLYKDIRAEPDYSPVSYDSLEYPSIAAEIGPGIMPLYKRRPYFVEASIAPMMVRMLGSGSNGIGYYMYHGGTTPIFDGRFFSEESSGLPKVNYDFQAPIGEYGQTRSHYRSLKLLHLYLASYGDELAPMQTILPASNGEIEATTKDVLRYAVRAKGEQAFVFMHNFQDHLESADIDAVSLELEVGEGVVRIPAEGSFDLKASEWAIFPVNQPLAGTRLISATVQPLTVLKNDEATHHVFVSIPGIRPEFVFPESARIEGEGFELFELAGQKVVRFGSGDFSEFRVNGESVLLVSKERGENAFVLSEGRILFSDSLVLEGPEGLQCLTKDEERSLFYVYPNPLSFPVAKGARLVSQEAQLASVQAFAIEYPEIETGFKLERRSSSRVILSKEGDGLNGLHEVYLEVDYVGDRAAAFIRGGLVADHLFHGKKWEIGLKRFTEALDRDNMVIEFHALSRDAEFLKEFAPAHRPVFEDGEEKILRIESLRIVPEYEAILSW